MWRSVLTILLAAALGSVGGTLCLTFFDGGTGSLDPARFIYGLSSLAFYFTVPGALMLFGLQAVLMERQFSSFAAGLWLAILGGLVGGLVLAILFGAPGLAALGALYGVLTAIALLSVQALPGLNPGATR